jgi:Protein CHAPERONE-LIKE PROTEIN OF POR1-like
MSRTVCASRMSLRRRAPRRCACSSLLDSARVILLLGVPGSVCSDVITTASFAFARHIYKTCFNAWVDVQVQQSVLSKIPGGGVSIALPPNQQLGAVGAGYAVLFAWAFAQGATESYAAQQSDTMGLQLALGFAGAVYFLREKKRVGLGRSVLYGLGSLIAGTVLGSLIESWLRVDIVPILGMGSPGVFAGEFGLVGLATAAICLA